MRSLVLSLVLASLAVACATPVIPPSDDTSSADSSTSKKKSSSKSDDTSDDDDDDSSASTSTSTKAPSAATTSSASFTCSGAGIAAFADALVKAGRQDCTSAGVGVVNNQNYACTKTAINSLAPPHPDTAYSIVTTLLAPNQDFPMLECTYFIQMVTSGVCGTPLSPSDQNWQDYPLAFEFINKAPSGWTWMPNNGTNQVQVGDIMVYDSTDGQNDPGHIMIVAEIHGTQLRIAEANEVDASGQIAFGGETGIMSNTRITTLTDANEKPAGWMRLNAQ